MSLNFKNDGKMLWNPGMRVGHIFLAYVTALEPLVEQRAGIVEVIHGDTYEVNGEETRQFAEVLLDWYIMTNSPVLRAMVECVLRTCLVLAERAGSPVEISPKNAPAETVAERREFAQKIASSSWPMVI
jgi:hypothetical protein